MRPDSIEAYAQVAMQRLEPDVWRYLAQTGVLTDAANRRAFDERIVVPRMLADVRGAHTRVELFGQVYQHPFLLAPIAYQRLFHNEGEIGCAMAAAAQGGAMIISSLASQPLEAIVEAHLQTGMAPWFQLYWQGSRDDTLALALRALKAGCSAIVFTVDAPVKPVSITLPAHVAAVNLVRPLSSSPVQPGQSQVFDGWMSQAPRWEDLAWLRQQMRVPLLIKGILHPDDAERAVASGCDGIIVSNHGGRVLDGVPASMDALSSVLLQVDGRVPVLLDSGVRSGLDACRALQAGARAVLVGRPAMWGLASEGARGVARVIRILRDELEVVMALCGMKGVATGDFD